MYCLSVSKRNEIQQIGKILQNKVGFCSGSFERYRVPCREKGFIMHAMQHCASGDVLDEIKNLPEKEYTNAADVAKEFKGN